MLTIEEIRVDAKSGKVTEFRVTENTCRLLDEPTWDEGDIVVFYMTDDDPCPVHRQVIPQARLQYRAVRSGDAFDDTWRHLSSMDSPQGPVHVLWRVHPEDQAKIDAENEQRIHGLAALLERLGPPPSRLSEEDFHTAG